MKLGSVAVVVMALAVPGAWELNLGCSHDARPVVQPDDHPPVPPASGTPIGHLVDSASELTLSADQLGQLREIDGQLAAQLATDDSDMRPEPVAGRPAQDGKPRGLGFRAGGVAQGGQGSSLGAFPSAPAGNAGDGGQLVIPAATVNHVYQQRAHHVRDAIRRAFDVLDAGQQAIANRLLTDHGVNVDTGEVAGGDPGAAKLEAPKLGQPLPSER